jgi:hypothetical protein
MLVRVTVVGAPPVVNVTKVLRPTPASYEKLGETAPVPFVVETSTLYVPATSGVSVRYAVTVEAVV